MDKPTPEQIKEFWERYGIEERFESDTGTWYYHYPNHQCDIELPPIDLNSLFLYAVPKLEAFTLSKQVGEAEYKSSVLLDGYTGYIPDHTPNFTQFLDACFKHLMPKALEVLKEQGHCPPIVKLFQLWYDELVILTGDSSNIEQAALALCLVFDKLIDQESLAKKVHTLRVQMDGPGSWGSG